MAKKTKQSEEETPVRVAVTQAPSTGTKETTSISSSANKAAKETSIVSKTNDEKTLEKEKNKKVKMIRDSFTLPEHDYAKLSELKKKCLKAGVHVKKSELIRAGLLGLSTLPDASLLKVIGQVEVIKTGRPAKE